MFGQINYTVCFEDKDDVKPLGPKWDLSFYSRHQNEIVINQVSWGGDQNTN